MPYPRAPQRLLMVMPHRRLVRKAVTAGFGVWSVWDPSLRDDAYLDEVEFLSQELLLADFSDEHALRALIRETAGTHGVDEVVHLGVDATLPTVSTEAERLGLALNPAKTLRRLNGTGAARGYPPGPVLDRWLLRRELAAHGVSLVDCALVTDRRSLETFGALSGYPFLVRPTAPPGPVSDAGAVRVRRPADLPYAWRLARGGGFLMEAYVAGPRGGVDAVSYAGVHQVTGTDGAAGDEAARAVTRFLALLGVTDGHSHTELRLGVHGPVVVDVHLYGGPADPVDAARHSGGAHGKPRGVHGKRHGAGTLAALPAPPAPPVPAGRARTGAVAA
ncbi:ATP-grasp domain-containing protein [Streptomyces sp. O3]